MILYTTHAILKEGEAQTISNPKFSVIGEQEFESAILRLDGSPEVILNKAVHVLICALLVAEGKEVSLENIEALLATI